MGSVEAKLHTFSSALVFVARCLRHDVKSLYRRVMADTTVAGSGTPYNRNRTNVFSSTIIYRKN